MGVHSKFLPNFHISAGTKNNFQFINKFNTGWKHMVQNTHIIINPTNTRNKLFYGDEFSIIPWTTLQSL